MTHRPPLRYNRARRTIKRGENGICPNSQTATHREDREDVRYDGGARNRRSVWAIATKPYKGSHFATFPPDLIEPCVLAGAPEGGVVLDPFGGSGTTAGVAVKNNRKAILCELNEEYTHLVADRVKAISGHETPHPLDDLI